MRDLTSGVAALRDRFAKDGRDRAAAIHERLAAYALDRRDARIASYGAAKPAPRAAAKEPPARAGIGCGADAAIG